MRRPFAADDTMDGEAGAAKQVDCQISDEMASLSFDLSAAYPPQARLKRRAYFTRAEADGIAQQWRHGAELGPK